MTTNLPSALLAAVVAVAVSACQPVTQNTVGVGDNVKLHDQHTIVCHGYDNGYGFAGQMFVTPNLIHRDDFEDLCGYAPRGLRYVVTEKREWPWEKAVSAYCLFPENGTGCWWIVVRDNKATFEDVRSAPPRPTLRRASHDLH
jgi:hypothetical protein